MTRRNLEIKTRVEVRGGRHEGKVGKVVRVCSLTGFVSITMDERVRKDPAYEAVLFGPFMTKELKVIEKPKHVGKFRVR